uniref:Uncharacterized protein n=1 Tax=Solanum lycopersicum TaxID=4081 RepID=A0A3Q7I5N4_SOLLC
MVNHLIKPQIRDLSLHKFPEKQNHRHVDSGLKRLFQKHSSINRYLKFVEVLLPIKLFTFTINTPSSAIFIIIVFSRKQSA